MPSGNKEVHLNSENLEQIGRCQGTAKFRLISVEAGRPVWGGGVGGGGKIYPEGSAAERLISVEAGKASTGREK